MPTEGELRAWLKNVHQDGATRVGLDPSAIIRRSRRRRLPKQLALGGTVTLAVAGIGVAGVTGIRGLTLGATSSSIMSSEDSGTSGGETAPEAATDGIGRAPAEKLNLCGGALAEVAPSQTGLVLTTNFPATVPAGTQSVDGTVILTNTGTERVTGTTAASPAITLSQDGIVLWHSNGPMIMLAVLVDLGPGESMEYPASFTPVRCDVEDDAAESFRENLPPLAPGVYQVSAAIDLTPDTAEGGALADLVVGPTAPVTIG